MWLINFLELPNLSFKCFVLFLLLLKHGFEFSNLVGSFHMLLLRLQIFTAILIYLLGICYVLLFNIWLCLQLWSKSQNSSLKVYNFLGHFLHIITCSCNFLIILQVIVFNVFASLMNSYRYWTFTYYLLIVVLGHCWSTLINFLTCRTSQIKSWFRAAWTLQEWVLYHVFAFSSTRGCLSLGNAFFLSSKSSVGRWRSYLVACTRTSCHQAFVIIYSAVKTCRASCRSWRPLICRLLSTLCQPRSKRPSSLLAFPLARHELTFVFVSSIIVLHVSNVDIDVNFSNSRRFNSVMVSLGCHQFALITTWRENVVAPKNALRIVSKDNVGHAREEIWNGGELVCVCHPVVVVCLVVGWLLLLVLNGLQRLLLIITFLIISKLRLQIHYLLLQRH